LKCGNLRDTAGATPMRHLCYPDRPSSSSRKSYLKGTYKASQTMAGGSGAFQNACASPGFSSRRSSSARRSKSPGSPQRLDAVAGVACGERL